MIVVGLDLETDGLDTAVNRVIEIGLVIWDTDLKKPIRIFSQMVNDPLAVIDPVIARTTGIKVEDLQTYGLSPVQAYRAVRVLLGTPGLKAVVAHNGNEFDRPMLASNMARHGEALPEMHWIDTMVDINYPPEITSRKLVHLAAEHGFVNPFAHRAVFDVLTTLKVLSHYDAEEVFSTSCEPFVTLKATAVVAPWKDDGKSNAEVKAAGFRWDGASKVWFKKMRRSHYEPGAITFPVAVEEAFI